MVMVVVMMMTMTDTVSEISACQRFVYIFHCHISNPETADACGIFSLSQTLYLSFILFCLCVVNLQPRLHLILKCVSIEQITGGQPTTDKL